jgi:hypothetical protein
MSFQLLLFLLNFEASAPYFKPNDVGIRVDPLNSIPCMKKHRSMYIEKIYQWCLQAGRSLQPGYWTVYSTFTMLLFLTGYLSEKMS